MAGHQQPVKPEKSWDEDPEGGFSDVLVAEDSWNP